MRGGEAALCGDGGWLCMLQPCWWKTWSKVLSPLSSWAGELMEFGDHSLQVGVVEVTCNSKDYLKVYSLLFTNGSMKFFNSKFSISIRDNICCSHNCRCKFSRQVERSTFHHEVLQGSRAVTIPTHQALFTNMHSPFICLYHTQTHPKTQTYPNHSQLPSQCPTPAIVRC